MNGDLLRKVAIVGVGLTKFGERYDASLRNLVSEAGIACFEDAGMSNKDIDALYVGNMASGRLTEQEHVGALVADELALSNVPALKVENACASGGTAFRQAYMAVASGMHDRVMALGVEKMTDVSTSEATTGLGGAGDKSWELDDGITFPGLYALMARRHMHDYGTTEEQMAAVAVKNHANAYKNKYAHFHKIISIDDAIRSKMIADPLKLYDCSPISDGSASLIMVPAEDARKYTDTPIIISGSAQASDTLRLADRDDITSIKAARIAAEKAYSQAKIKPSDVNVAEVHDCFTIAEIIAMEDLGFYKKGEAAKAIFDGDTGLNGKVSVNTSGGLKGCGHPVGATGIKQAVEIVWQLRGEAEGRQVSNAKIGLTHNVGGSGSTAIVNILERGD